MRSVPKILIVEDNRELRGLICRSLKKDGYRVAEAEGGRSMQRQLDEGRVDLIVLDIMLPGQDNQVCLLYTSPSPRDGLLSRMPSSA